MKTTTYKSSVAFNAMRVSQPGPGDEWATLFSFVTKKAEPATDQYIFFSVREIILKSLKP